MKKQYILKLMKSRLEKHQVEQKDMILEWLDELIEDKIEKNDILSYTEKMYEKRYPGEIFVDRPISPKLRLEVHRFEINMISDYSEYKKFAEWLVQIAPKIVNRKTIPFDLVNIKLYEHFKKREEEDTEVITEKRSLHKNRLIRV